MILNWPAFIWYLTLVICDRLRLKPFEFQMFEMGLIVLLDIERG